MRMKHGPSRLRLVGDAPDAHADAWLADVAGHLPAAVTTVVHPERLTWVQETIHDHDERSARFRLLPDHYPDRLRCRGRFTITDQPGGSRRVVAGELQVKAPLVGGRVEQAIVSGLEEYLEAEAPVVDAWIRGSG